MSSLATKGAKGELVFTSFLFALSLIILWDTTQLSESALTGSVSPKAFAYGVGGLLFVLSSVQIVQVLRGKLGEPEEIDGGVATPKPNWKALGLVIGAIVLHIVLWLAGHHPRNSRWCSSRHWPSTSNFTSSANHLHG